MTTGADTRRLERVAVNLIDVRPGGQDRTSFDRTDLEALAASFAPDGPAFPPIVRPMPAGRFELVAGERRTRAMRDVLGWSTILVEVRDLDDVTAAAVMLAENTARVDLDPLDEGRAYAHRLEAGATIADIARTAGRSAETVRARVALLALVDDVAHYVRTRQLPLAYAAPMTTLDTNRQRLALLAFNESRPSLDAHRKLCARLLEEQNAESMFDTDSFLRVDEYVAQAAAELADERAENLAPVREPVWGIAEIAAALKVKRGTVNQWRFRGALPAPDMTIGDVPAWWRSSVTAWARDTGRKVTT